MKSVLCALAGAALVSVAGHAAAADTASIHTFERDGKISLLVSDGAAGSVAPDGITLPSASGTPHTCRYPAMAARWFQRGEVQLSMTITRDGRVANLALSKPNNSGYLNNGSLECVKNWLYTPAMRDGVPITAEHTVQLTWILNGY